MSAASRESNSIPVSDTTPLEPVVPIDETAPVVVSANGHSADGHSATLLDHAPPDQSSTVSAASSSQEPTHFPETEIADTEFADAKHIAAEIQKPGHLTANSIANSSATQSPERNYKPAYSGSTYSDGDYRWNRGSYSRPQRFIDIWSFVLKLLSKRWLYGKAWSYGGTITPEKQAKRRQDMAVWIRETCLSLGPTFIKIGQLFSTRADLFPIEYVEELS
ncbi:MAG: hypothetical protein AAFV46_11625, partial [Cyanobacteria bacterium J06635_11]